MDDRHSLRYSTSPFFFSIQVTFRSASELNFQIFQGDRQLFRQNAWTTGQAESAVLTYALTPRSPKQPDWKPPISLPGPAAVFPSSRYTRETGGKGVCVHPRQTYSLTKARTNQESENLSFRVKKCQRHCKRNICKAVFTRSTN